MDHPRTEYRRPTLNAAPADQIRLLDLQALDSRLDQLAHRRRTLPEHAQVEQLSERFTTVRDLLVAAQTEEGDIGREQTKAEADVDAVRARASRDQQRLDSGMITSSKELTNLQHEIVSLARRQADLEEIVLDCMERRENAQNRVTELETERERVADQRGEAERRRKAVLAEIDADAGFVRKQRDTLAPDVPSDLLALYEKLRGQQGGVGAAALRQRRCEGCRLELGITELNAARKAAPEAVLRCESCRRILVRTPESGL